MKPPPATPSTDSTKSEQPPHNLSDSGGPQLLQDEWDAKMLAIPEAERLARLRALLRAQDEAKRKS